MISWEACSSWGSCSVLAAWRRAGHRFGTPVRLDPVDPSQAPVATISRGGEGLVGWIAGGKVYVAEGRGAAPRFGAARVISAGTGPASGLARSFGPGREAIAAWTQGAGAETVVVAVYRQG